jgi:hypothetical protein
LSMVAAPLSYIGVLSPDFLMIGHPTSCGVVAC